MVNAITSTFWCFKDLAKIHRLWSDEAVWVFGRRLYLGTNCSCFNTCPHNNVSSFVSFSYLCRWWFTSQMRMTAHQNLCTPFTVETMSLRPPLLAHPYCRVSVCFSICLCVRLSFFLSVRVFPLAVPLLRHVLLPLALRGRVSLQLSPVIMK